MSLGPSIFKASSFFFFEIEEQLGGGGEGEEGRRVMGIIRF